MIASLIAFAAATPATDCTPTRIEPVCAFQHSSRGITLKMLINSDQARCGEIRSRGPTDRVPTIRAFTPRFPVTSIVYSAPHKGRYIFQASWQVGDRRRNNACPVPFNFGGGAAQIIVE